MVIAALRFLDRPPPVSLIPLPHPVVSPEVQSKKGEGNSVGDTLGTTLLSSSLQLAYTFQLPWAVPIHVL